MTRLRSASVMRMAGDQPPPADSCASWFVEGIAPELMVRRFWEFDDASKRFVCTATVEAPVEMLPSTGAFCEVCGTAYTELTRAMNPYCSSKCRQRATKKQRLEPERVAEKQAEEEFIEAMRFAHLLDDMGIPTGHNGRLKCRCPPLRREHGIPEWLSRNP